MDIRQYLVDVAAEITASAPTLPSGEDWDEWQQARRRSFLEMLGIDHLWDQPRTPLNVQVTQRHRRDGYRIECLTFESLPGLHVDGNLYVPDAPGPHPGILYVCGHTEDQKASHYQQHARRYAQLGFVTLIVDTVQLGEVRGYHHGPYRFGWFHWYSRGYTPAGVEVWNGIRALDLLAGRDDVDAERLGVTGTSGGGAQTWWIAAADTRVKVASPSCGTGTIASHVALRTVDTHCDCMFPINLFGWSLVDMGALIAPRPLLIVSADRDALFSIDSIEDFHRRLARVYAHAGRPENLELFTFRAPHSYQQPSRRRTFHWFLTRLKGETVELDHVADVDGHVEEFRTLAVHVNGLPANNRSTTVHDWFVPKAAPPVIDSPEALAKERERVVARLRETTFSAFPKEPVDPDPVVTQESLLRDGNGFFTFTFQTERGWRLTGALSDALSAAPAGAPGAAPAVARQETPVVVSLMDPDDHFGVTRGPGTPGVPSNWRQALLSPRGTGDTAWAPSLQWHLRRAAALTGRTLASLRVFDVLQGLAAIRRLMGDGAADGAGAGVRSGSSGKGTAEIYLRARGEMAAIALYAALLDGGVAGLILHDPPATQNAPGAPDGTGPCLEMLGCLRVTDLPQVAGLLWPAKLVFVGGRPESYLWAEELYERLGPPGGHWSVSELRHWRV